jgi:hypothetical protein
MEINKLLAISMVGAYVLTHEVAKADVPGKPVTLLANFVALTSNTSNTAVTVVMPNMANPYGSDFRLPPTDRLGKITLS